MKTHTQVVIIGGGVVGVSVLYHLTKIGWTDVVLLEKNELTSGSTWHAAGLLPLFNMSYSVGQIHKYSVQLYRSLEAETGRRPASAMCNVTSEDDVQGLVAAAVRELGGIDVMINNAGLGGTANLVDMTDDQWNVVIDVTLNGTMRAARSCQSPASTRSHRRDCAQPEQV